MRMGDRTGALLAAAGFASMDLAHASALLMSHAIGAATTAAAVASPEQIWEDGFAFGLDRLLDGLQLWLDRGKG